MSSTKRGSQRSPADNYPSPAWAVHRFLDRFISETPNGVLVLSKRLWLEPAAGEGNLIWAAQEWFRARPEVIRPLWHACELRPECKPYLDDLEDVQEASIGDYFVAGSPKGSYDLVITNPPFSLAMQFIEAGLKEDTRFVIMLQRLNFVGTAKRHAFMQRCPPDQWVLPNRPSFKATGETDSIEYAWFVWDKENLERPYGRSYILDLTPKDERKAEHERLKNSGIFPLTQAA